MENLVSPETLADPAELVRRYRLTESFEGAGSHDDIQQFDGSLSTETSSLRRNGVEREYRQLSEKITRLETENTELNAKEMKWV